MRNTRVTRVTLEQCHWDEAVGRLSESRVFKGSHREHEANEVGVLGEIVVEAWFSKNQINFFKHTERTDFDYIANNYTIDVKTKDRTVPPKKQYDCSIPLYNHDHQKPDYYIFVSLLRDRHDCSGRITRFKSAYIIGGISQNELATLGKIWRKDQLDPSNGTIFWTDCINVQMGDLIPLEEMIKVLR